MPAAFTQAIRFLPALLFLGLASCQGCNPVCTDVGYPTSVLLAGEASKLDFGCGEPVRKMAITPGGRNSHLSWSDLLLYSDLETVQAPEKVILLKEIALRLCPDVSTGITGKL